MRLLLLPLLALLLSASAAPVPTVTQTTTPLLVQHFYTDPSEAVWEFVSSEDGIWLVGPSSTAAEATSAAIAAHTLTSSWTSGGVKHTVSTPAGVGERSQDLAMKRHARMITKMQAYFPVDP